MLRPEQITLAGFENDAAGLEGRVLDVIFFGDATRYIVALPSGFTLTVQSTDHDPCRVPGTRVMVGWQSAHVWLVPRPD
jgi:hypothetical protein